jgi:outer membrane lipopolysaccharide assembly protein LptE/RlpB
MRKTLAISMMLAAALGLAACDKKSEDKAQETPMLPKLRLNRTKPPQKKQHLLLQPPVLETAV